MKCKNCGHHIFKGIKFWALLGCEAPREIPTKHWFSKKEKAKYEKKFGELKNTSTSVKCFCGCEKPEPAELEGKLASAQREASMSNIHGKPYYSQERLDEAHRAGELAGLAKVVVEWTRVFYEDYDRDYPEKLKEFGVWLERKKSELEGKEG